MPEEGLAPSRPKPLVPKTSAFAISPPGQKSWLSKSSNQHRKSSATPAPDALPSSPMKSPISKRIISEEGRSSTVLDAVNQYRIEVGPLLVRRAGFEPALAWLLRPMPPAVGLPTLSVFGRNCTCDLRFRKALPYLLGYEDDLLTVSTELDRAILDEDVKGTEQRIGQIFLEATVRESGSFIGVALDPTNTRREGQVIEDALLIADDLECTSTTLPNCPRSPITRRAI